MAALSENELEEVFVDVRKAYRLVYSYQRRVLDMIDFIRIVLEQKSPMGKNIFSTPVLDGKAVDLKRWAWDWLPLYCHEFKFEDKKVGEETYTFAIAVYADNGAEDRKKDFDETEVEFFAPVENAQTQIYFYVGRNLFDTEAFGTVWGSASPDFYEEKTLNGHFLSHRFPLSQLRDEGSIIEKLKVFQSFCHSKGMTDFLPGEI